ncbi:MAG: carboxypeptidase regulatory-like domain-containing protein [Betaproteobacteria bacterium]|nr:carboxypeptidase regulatory-like domain-containing protein [Betaproteobacteria bacterium]
MPSVVRLIAAMLVAVALPVAGQSAADVTGRVFDAGSRAGIPSVEVKLTPPRSTNQPIRLAISGNDGSFVFRQLPRGRYMVEASQGYKLLYRSTVDTAAQPRIDIPLQRAR